MDSLRTIPKNIPIKALWGIGDTQITVQKRNLGKCSSSGYWAQAIVGSWSHHFLPQREALTHQLLDSENVRDPEGGIEWFEQQEWRCLDELG